ncbi:tetratricopeptide repeat protein [Mycolicibacterium sp. XJ870]
MSPPQPRTDVAAAITTLASELGARHPAILSVRIALETRNIQDGNLAEARQRWNALYDDCAHTLGESNPTTLGVGYMLARLHALGRDFAGALALAADIVAIRERATGPEHPDVLLNRTEMAYWCGLSGDTSTAAAELNALVPSLYRVLGEDHTATFAAEFNHALWRDWTDDVPQAIAVWEALVETSTRLFGAHHPGAAQARQAIAFWQRYSHDSVKE